MGELYLYPYQAIFRLSPLFIESQICNKCLKCFLLEIVLLKLLSICRGPGFEDFEEEMDFYRSFFEDAEYNNNEYYNVDY